MDEAYEAMLNSVKKTCRDLTESLDRVSHEMKKRQELREKENTAVFPMVLMNDFNSQKSDTERWRWLIDNKDNGVTVVCDNGCTYITIEGMEEKSIFASCVGSSNGLLSLLEAIGIKATTLQKD